VGAELLERGLDPGEVGVVADADEHVNRPAVARDPGQLARRGCRGAGGTVVMERQRDDRVAVADGAQLLALEQLVRGVGGRSKERRHAEQDR
jgi:hypothetical protein